jgi:hypothetical protein
MIRASRRPDWKNVCSIDQSKLNARNRASVTVGEKNLLAKTP